MSWAAFLGAEEGGTEGERDRGREGWRYEGREGRIKGGREGEKGRTGRKWLEAGEKGVKVYLFRVLQTIFLLLLSFFTSFFYFFLC